MNEYANHIVARLPVSILILEGDGKIIFANDHFLKSMGKEIDQVVGRKLEEVFGSALVNEAGFNGKIQQVLKSQEKQPPERFRWRRRFYDYRVLSIAEPVGHGHHVLLVIEDVTEKVYLEDQLRHAEKMSAIGRLTAGAAHEINNPLSVILSNVQYLLSEWSEWGAVDSKKLPRGKDLLETLQVIEQETHRCGEIVAHLLEFSHKGRPVKEAVDLNQVVRKMVQLFERWLQSLAIEPIVELSKQLPQIEGNTNHLQQALVNLILNAKDAMPKGGKLYIYTVQEGLEWVHIVVRDTGVGIPQKYLSRVFEPFFTTKKVGQGTGLGLSVTHSIVEDHGGNIRVESQEGRGATFTIALPIARKKMVGRVLTQQDPQYRERSPHASL